MSKYNYYMKIESVSNTGNANSGGGGNQNIKGNTFNPNNFARETSPYNPNNSGGGSVFDPKNIMDTKKIVGYISKNLIFKTRI